MEGTARFWWAMRTVALGSVDGGDEDDWAFAALGSEKGRKGGESASSSSWSSLSESGPRAVLAVECRGRRMYARLRDMGGAVSESEEEEVESSALLEALPTSFSFDAVSVLLRGPSRAFAGWKATPVDSNPDCCMIVGEGFWIC